MPKMTQKQLDRLCRPVWEIKSTFCSRCGKEIKFPVLVTRYVKDKHGDVQLLLIPKVEFYYAWDVCTCGTVVTSITAKADFVLAS